MAEIPHRLQVGQSFEQSIPFINEAFESVDGENRTKVVRNGNTPTVLFGYQKAGFNGLDYGLKVAKPGYDVTTTADANLAFSSAFNNLKVVQTGTKTVECPAISTSGIGLDNASNGYIPVPHGLGYTPVLIAFIQDSTRYTPIPWDTGFASNVGNQVVGRRLNVTVDATNVYFTATTYTLNLTGAAYNQLAYGAQTIKYYLLQESAN